MKVKGRYEIRIKCKNEDYEKTMFDYWLVSQMKMVADNDYKL